jgi:thiosulfate/3-mercaptopyruvate sulfurtransferase
MMKVKLIKMMMVTVLLLYFTTVAAAAQWANPGLLVDAETVKANINKADWVVVDARDLKDYVKGHIPGAISLGKRGKKAFRDATSRVFKDVSKYEKMLGKAGIGNDTHVVFYYGDIKTMNDATVGFWVMEYLGHDKVHVLDGGLEAWRKSGNRLDKEPTIKKAKTFKANVVKSRYASTAEIVGIGTGQTNGIQLIDSRTKNEFIGKDVRAVQAGHVPGAINISHLDTLLKVKDTKTGKMKATAVFTPDSVAKLASLDRSKRTVAYCQTGTRSTLTYLQLRLLGFEDPANWDDSWRVYGSDLHAANPIEAPNGVQYWNFAKVNKTLKKLGKKVKKLEAQVKKLSDGK